MEDTDNITPNLNGNKRNADGTFAIGSSGGPGRPPGSLSITSMIKRKLQEIPLGQTRTYAESMVLDILELAVVKKDPATIRTIWQYIDGNPKQKLEVGGDKESIAELTEFFKMVAEKPTTLPNLPVENDPLFPNK